MHSFKREHKKLTIITILVIIVGFISLYQLITIFYQPPLFILGCLILAIITYFLVEQFNILEIMQSIPTEYTKVRLLYPANKFDSYLRENIIKPVYIKRVGLKTLEVKFKFCNDKDAIWHVVLLHYKDARKVVDLSSI